ncbi:response regulator [Vibrio cincinnatiensis]|uniref:response regulator n=1 Tax=Vibrio cincinnatiensis TaxID=675 RepID=UPI001EE14269|nr:response regulator [Vibrio cincinnatiensis]MCG3761081.1 response regulator [Vibrio cincinnatiensis]MCG3764409.1 response regulator [Vibrio cincinnatiensis]
MSKTILVVDDSAAIRQVVSLSLKSAAYQTIEAIDGIDALRKIQGVKIHLVISDVNMPNMDGITLLKELKKQPSTKFTPVIMLTTESEATKKDQGRLAGAKAWVVKPFVPEQMLAAVNKLMPA